MIQRAQHQANRSEEAVVQSWDIRSMKVEPHKPQILRSSDEARSIAINLPAGDELQEHRTHEATYLVVADGEVEVSQADEVVVAPAGFLAYFDANEARRVRATSDARIVLILGPWPGEGHPRHS